MKTIVVSKTGMSFCTREFASLNSATGEQGETEGILRHLKARGDCRVVYFGAHRGDMTELCHRAVTPSVHRLNEGSTQKDQDAGWEEDRLAMEDEECVGMINVAGPPATFSHHDNPKQSIIQLQGAKYTGPILRLLEARKMPRCVINNDPRTYPRDQEMSYGWKWTRPRALLDQCSSSVAMVVGGCSYLRNSVYAGCESWAWLPKRPNAKAVPCTVVAHAHINDGIRQKGREQSWYNVLGPREEWPKWFRVYGAGWEHYRDYSDDATEFIGPIRPDDALEQFQLSMTTPCVAAAPGFYTGKPYVAFSQGCIPLLYGNGRDPYTWDPEGVLVPLVAVARVVKPGDLWSNVTYTASMYDAAFEYWTDKLKPRWQKLDQLVDCLLEGRELGDTFGGYFRC